ncbi:hypothetical protein [Amycolatopsis jiangsuensis]|uniref:Uncharacterized protein n=1 Tax=Amycolatopsis jiangsuensis TaxID=1181879 RepID=A0A840IKD5_9PSEU|nr:hypothetical protein [Amycolatopsis jiangsuensis]MBB4682756.1 hypothetical protein [Amycolatopsis jiangsuensis]
MPRTPRPNAPDDRPRRAAGRRADVRGRLPDDRAPDRLPDDRAADDFDAPAERPPDAFAGVREPRADAFPPPLPVLRFLVADPAIPPR